MNDVPPVAIPENGITFQQMCNNINRLYEGIDEIQFFEGRDKHISFWVITSKNTLDGDYFHRIQQDILTEFGKNHGGLKCSVNTIRQVNKGDIISQNEVGTSYIREVCKFVESKFQRENIHIQFKNGEFIIYGAAPKDYDAIHAAISEYTPHNMNRILSFKTLREWEDNRSVSDTITRTSDDFSGVGVPRTFGFSLILGQLGRVLAERYFPR